MVSLVNSIKQESSDKSNAYESRVYFLLFRFINLKLKFKNQKNNSEDNNKQHQNLLIIKEFFKLDKLNMCMNVINFRKV